MKHKKASTEPEWEMIGHDPVPGYRTAFYVAVGISVIFLAAAFLFGGAFGGH
jgi:hypothetical protein